MRGSIRAKVPGKVFEIRVSLGRDPATGRYRQHSLTVRGTRSDAQRALRRLLDDLEAGPHRFSDGGSRTFGDLLDEWLAFKTTADRSPTTIARYRSSIERELKPALGGRRLDGLYPKAFDDLYRALAKRLSPASIMKTHVVARAALDRAVRWGWIERNPALNAEPPRVRRSAIRPPGPEAVSALVELAEREDPTFATLLRVAASTGARRGELCALRWTDVDYERGTITIERGVILVDGGLEERPTKTHNRRVVSLDAGTLNRLRQHRQSEEFAAAACGSSLNPGAFVFSRRPGGTAPLRPDNCTATFDKLTRQAGLSGFSLKDATRHLAATQLIAGGVDVRTVAGRLGHARASTTLDIYSHWLPARDQQAAELLGQVLDAAAADAPPSGSRKARST